MIVWYIKKNIVIIYKVIIKNSEEYVFWNFFTTLNFNILFLDARHLGKEEGGRLFKLIRTE